VSLHTSALLAVIIAGVSAALDEFIGRVSVKLIRALPGYSPWRLRGQTYRVAPLAVRGYRPVVEHQRVAFLHRSTQVTEDNACGQGHGGVHISKRL
jgi:hypothetical protein